MIDIERVENKLKEYMGQIELLEEEQRKVEKERDEEREKQARYSEEKQKYSDFAGKINLEVESRLKEKAAMKEKVNRFKKFESNLFSLGGLILLLEFISCAAMLIAAFAFSDISFLWGALVSYVTMGVASSVSFWASFKCSFKRDNLEWDIAYLEEIKKELTNSVKITKEKISSLDNEISASLVKQDVMGVNLESIRINLAYFEEQVWMILQNIKPEDCTEYISQLKENFVPKVFIKEQGEKKLTHSFEK